MQGTELSVLVERPFYSSLADIGICSSISLLPKPISWSSQKLKELFLIMSVWPLHLSFLLILKLFHCSLTRALSSKKRITEWPLIWVILVKRKGLTSLCACRTCLPEAVVSHKSLLSHCYQCLPSGTRDLCCAEFLNSPASWLSGWIVNAVIKFSEFVTPRIYHLRYVSFLMASCDLSRAVWVEIPERLLIKILRFGRAQVLAGFAV